MTSPEFVEKVRKMLGFTSEVSERELFSVVSDKIAIAAKSAGIDALSQFMREQHILTNNGVPAAAYQLLRELEKQLLLQFPAPGVRLVDQLAAVTGATKNNKNSAVFVHSVLDTLKDTPFATVKLASGTAHERVGVLVQLVEERSAANNALLEDIGAALDGVNVEGGRHPLVDRALEVSAKARKAADVELECELDAANDTIARLEEAVNVERLRSAKGMKANTKLRRKLAVQKQALRAILRACIRKSKC